MDIMGHEIEVVTLMLLGRWPRHISSSSIVPQVFQVFCREHRTIANLSVSSAPGQAA